MKIFPFGFAVILLMLVGCGKSGEENPKTPKSGSLDVRSNPAILFKNLDFRDTVNIGDTVQVSYNFVNDGYKNLEIKNVTNDGTCQVKWTEGIIKPVMAGKVEMTCVFNYPGLIKQGFMVSHNGPQPDVPLTLRVFVQGGEDDSEPSPKGQKININ